MKCPYRLLPLLLLVPSFAYAESYYVQPPQAKLYEKPSLTAPVVAVVPQGTCFDDVTRSGAWIRVSHGGKTAWLPALTAAVTPPRQKVAVKSEEQSPTAKLRSRASAAPTVVAGMKGLASDDRRRLSSGQNVDYDALGEMEHLTVTDEELEWFAKGGKP